MISAFQRSCLYPFDVVLMIFGFRFALGRCHEKDEIFMNMSSFHEQISFHGNVEISWKRIQVCLRWTLLSSIQSGGTRAWVGEFYTCSSHGKLWLTVSRAHASLWVQLTWEEFSLTGRVITFGILSSLCQSIVLEKSPSKGNFFHDTEILILAWVLWSH